MTRLKSGVGWFASRQGREKISDLVHETVLVADLEPRHPPMIHVRMVAAMVRDMDRTPTADRRVVRIIEELQPMQIVQVPPQ